MDFVHMGNNVRKYLCTTLIGLLKAAILTFARQTMHFVVVRTK